jgi:hypothetical protein
LFLFKSSKNFEDNNNDPFSTSKVVSGSCIDYSLTVDERSAELSLELVLDGFIISLKP